MLLFCRHYNRRLFVRDHCNTHAIRASSHETISGKPDELYLLPERIGWEDRLHPVLAQQIEIVAENLLQFEADTFWYQLYFKWILANLNIERPANCTDALNLYKELLLIL